MIPGAAPAANPRSPSLTELLSLPDEPGPGLLDDAYLAHKRSRPSLWTWLTLALVLLAALYIANRIAFLCDDAYIAFRYVSNAHEGHGLVWNAAPFQPVEGYTSLLWVLLLWATWSWLGVEPPVAANVLSMAFGVIQMAFVAGVALRLRGRNGARLPAVVGLCALVAIVFNRTFLQWLTSGLETALFNVALIGWVLLAFRQRQRRGVNWLLVWSIAAAAAALSRPDGLLLVAATGATALVLLAQKRIRLPQLLIGLTPLLLVATHVIWRRAFYGEWLPNTYYAKVVTAWPESGLRYFAGFAIEHGVWFWCLILFGWLATETFTLRGRVLRPLLEHLPATAAVGAIIFHCAYYVLMVGGDHFEYRVFSHLIPLGGLAAAAMLARTFRGVGMHICCLVGLGLAGSVGWVHLALTTDQPKAVPFYQPVAPKVPGWAQPMCRWYDRNQSWLQMHYVCCRCPQHALTLQLIQSILPETRARIPDNPNDLPVIMTPAAGMPGWLLPNCAVLDLLGLNDWVTARTLSVGPPIPHHDPEQLRQLIATTDADGNGRLEAAELTDFVAAVAAGLGGATDRAVDLILMLFAVERSDSLTIAEANTLHDFFAGLRFMAHERFAPAEYIQALDPNVEVRERKTQVRTRAIPLTEKRLRELETKWRAKTVR